MEISPGTGRMRIRSKMLAHDFHHHVCVPKTSRSILRPPDNFSPVTDTTARSLKMATTCFAWNKAEKDPLSPFFSPLFLFFYEYEYSPNVSISPIFFNSWLRIIGERKIFVKMGNDRKEIRAVSIVRIFLNISFAFEFDRIEPL